MIFERIQRLFLLIIHYNIHISMFILEKTKFLNNVLHNVYRLRVILNILLIRKKNKQFIRYDIITLLYYVILDLSTF